jgi:hypothetical protein
MCLKSKLLTSVLVCPFWNYTHNYIQSDEVVLKVELAHRHVRMKTTGIIR